MPLLAAKILVGFVVGVLIGMSGVGGGVLLLPVLIFGLRVPPIVAVGSDALFNFFTKIPASLLHLKKGTVRRKVVIALAAGSIPGSICRGQAADVHSPPLRRRGQQLYQDRGGRAADRDSHAAAVPEKDRRARRQSPAYRRRVSLGMAVIGLVAGFLVGMTSVGSGSIIMMLLLLFYSFPPKVNVGTDIVHAVILTGVTGLLHFRLGNVDPGLVVSLLIGSIPGGLLGSHLATRVPMLWLRRILCALLLITGARMLWA